MFIICLLSSVYFVYCLFIVFILSINNIQIETFITINDIVIYMATRVPVILKQVSRKAVAYVNGKKNHPRESFYEALDRVLQIQEVN
jgi:hypothetical protein